jgi:two-component system, chemotaxis family, chemotaxis protein CheY
MAKILIVEDSNLMISVITNFIKKDYQNITIVTARNGEEAVEKYTNEKPDLVFMDIKMPGMDGITALEKIKGKDPNAKIAMCTSLKEPFQEERAKKAGCVGYIMKPFSRQDIIDVIQKNIH